MNGRQFLTKTAAAMSLPYFVPSGVLGTPNRVGSNERLTIGIIGVRGPVQPVAKVTINGKPVANVRPSGYFLQAHFMSAGNPTIEVAVQYNGRKRTAKRTFKLRGPGDEISPR
jgi:hypothetical protein